MHTMAPKWQPSAALKSTSEGPARRPPQAPCTLQDHAARAGADAAGRLGGPGGLRAFARCPKHSTRVDRPAPRATRRRNPPQTPCDSDQGKQPTAERRGKRAAMPPHLGRSLKTLLHWAAATVASARTRSAFMLKGPSGAAAGLKQRGRPHKSEICSRAGVRTRQRTG